VGGAEGVAIVAAAVPGEAAALVTAFSWGFTALFFAAAARRLGTPLVNLVRLALASLLLGAVVLATGSAGPMPAGQVACLVLSGVIGLSLGDAAYFRALEYLGPRRASLLSTLAPVFTAVLMVPLLGEGLGIPGLVGMAITIGGVAWVQGERTGEAQPHPHAARGALHGVLGSLGQAGGYVLAKVGLGAAPAGSLLADLAGLEAAPGSGTAGEPVPALFGTFVRMVAATAFVVAGAALLRRPRNFADLARDRRGALATVGGTVMGPFLGVWMSLYAVSHANTAVASTILATSPVFVILLVRYAHGEKASARAWTGTVVALLGVAVLAFRRSLGG
jgi:drug/metabolite transporter (DMT)-like permease